MSRHRKHTSKLMRDQSQVSLFTMPPRRNLNRTWREIVLTQYAADLERELEMAQRPSSSVQSEIDQPFPIEYIIKATEWNRNVIIIIPRRLTLDDVCRSLNACRHTNYPTPDYHDANLSVRRYNPPPRPYSSCAKFFARTNSPPSQGTSRRNPPR